MEKELIMIWPTERRYRNREGLEAREPHLLQPDLTRLQGDVLHFPFLSRALLLIPLCVRWKGPYSPKA